MGCFTSSPSTHNDRAVSPYGNYTNHSEAVLLVCYFNPTNSEIRKQIFLKFVKSLTNCNYRIIECTFGKQTPFVQPGPFVRHVETDVPLWHKEALLNVLIRELPEQFKYVFWVDCDIFFTNKNWIVDSVDKLKEVYVVQPFEYAIHLERGEERPNDNTLQQRAVCTDTIEPRTKRRVWKSFASNYEKKKNHDSLDYDIHGHVGFAWGIRRSVLTQMMRTSEGNDGGILYDRALVGGADHIMAHAITRNPNERCHECVHKGSPLQEELNVIQQWSIRFFDACHHKLGFVDGDAVHMWHGELSDRQYYNRIKEFAPYFNRIVDRDENGLYVTKDPEIIAYLNNYFALREQTPEKQKPVDNNIKLPPKQQQQEPHQHQHQHQHVQPPKAQHGGVVKVSVGGGGGGESSGGGSGTGNNPFLKIHHGAHVGPPIGGGGGSSGGPVFVSGGGGGGDDGGFWYYG